jgi:predicted transcriptional regulator
MPSDLQLSDLQLALMRVLWDRGEATAQDVLVSLLEQQRDLAPTTVATLLSRLEKRGLVTHRTRGRQYVYRAELAEHDVRRSMVARVTEFFFGGDPAALLSHLVGDDDMTPDDLDEVKRLINAKEREAAEDDHG